MQIKRVSSEEIKQNYTQITGREALERLLAGEEIFSVCGYAWKISGNVVLARDYVIPVEHHGDTSSTEISALQVSAFLDPEDNDWYVAPPFDARKEMLARPGEWVAKYSNVSDGAWQYVGFDRHEMIAVESDDLKTLVSFEKTYETPATSCFDRAIPLDDADLAKLPAVKSTTEKGVNANG